MKKKNQILLTLVEFFSIILLFVLLWKFVFFKVSSELNGEDIALILVATVLSGLIVGFGTIGASSVFVDRLSEK